MITLYVYYFYQERNTLASNRAFLLERSRTPFATHLSHTVQHRLTTDDLFILYNRLHSNDSQLEACAEKSRNHSVITWEEQKKETRRFLVTPSQTTIDARFPSVLSGWNSPPPLLLHQMDHNRCLQNDLLIWCVRCVLNGSLATFLQFLRYLKVPPPLSSLILFPLNLCVIPTPLSFHSPRSFLSSLVPT